MYSGYGPKQIKEKETARNKERWTKRERGREGRKKKKIYTDLKPVLLVSRCVFCQVSGGRSILTVPCRALAPHPGSLCPYTSTVSSDVGTGQDALLGKPTF